MTGVNGEDGWKVRDVLARGQYFVVLAKKRMLIMDSVGEAVGAGGGGIPSIVGDGTGEEGGVSSRVKIAMMILPSLCSCTRMSEIENKMNPHTSKQIQSTSDSETSSSRPYDQMVYTNTSKGGQFLPLPGPPPITFKHTFISPSSQMASTLVAQGSQIRRFSVSVRHRAN